MPAHLASSCLPSSRPPEPIAYCCERWWETKSHKSWEDTRQTAAAAATGCTCCCLLLGTYCLWASNIAAAVTAKILRSPSEFVARVWIDTNWWDPFGGCFSQFTTQILHRSASRSDLFFECGFLLLLRMRIIVWKRLFRVEAISSVRRWRFANSLLLWHLRIEFSIWGTKRAMYFDNCSLLPNDVTDRFSLPSAPRAQARNLRPRLKVKTATQNSNPKQQV